MGIAGIAFIKAGKMPWIGSIEERVWIGRGGESDGMEKGPIESIKGGTDQYIG